MKKIVYPLEQVLDVKQKRVDDAERELEKKRRELEVEKEKLETCKEERQKVQDHLDEQYVLYEEVLSGLTTPDKILQLRRYIESVMQKLKIEDDKVIAQEREVRNAEIAVKEAKENWRLRRKELDKMETHKESWMEEANFEYQRELAKELDELGSIMFLNHLKKMKENDEEE